MSAITPERAVAIVMILALTAYALFGGADFGAGVWMLLDRGPRAESRRRVIEHAIGPIWEANHVWLIIVVVLLFTAFPAAFVAIMITLHIPVSLMLAGIVLRGSAFVFGAHARGARARRRWRVAFEVSSAATPILLGTIVGAIAAGRVETRPDRPLDLLWSWLSPFPIVVGLLTLALFSYLAAVYLTLESDDRAVRDDFRLRALAGAVASGVLAYAVYLLARSEAPLVFEGLGASRWGLPVRIATGVCATAALAALRLRRYRAARVAATAQIALILWGCALAQRPYLVPPDLTIQNAAAPAAVLRLLLGALAAGSIILFPSLFYLFRIFKRRPAG